MADAVDLDQHQFTCPICLDLLKDPVTLHCGHNYCMSCIQSSWDQEDQTEVYSCPTCRQDFTPRPVLNINNMLAEVVEKMKKEKVHDVSSAQCYAEPGDVECDVCTGRKHKAVKSCLVCLASYCQTHLQPHYESPAFKKHKLTDATGKLQEKICSLHDKLLEIYCLTHKQCICYLCTMDEHRGHDNISIKAARTQDLEQLKKTQKTFQQRIQEREKELQKLREAVDSLTRSAQAAVEDSERMYNELIESIKRKCSEMKKQIRDQKKAAVSQAEAVIDKLELEIDELKRRDSELEQLSHTEDDIYFLQRCQTLCALPGSEVVPTATIEQKQYFFQGVSAAVNGVKDELKDKLEVEYKGILEIFTGEVPRTREELLKYARQITLDSNTAYAKLSLSLGNLSVSTADQQSYPDHPERFTFCPQVLCREGLSGCHYWEVEWSGQDGVDIAVAYRGICGNGVSKNFRHSDKSWSLHCTHTGYQFYHNNKNTSVQGPYAPKIGVYLNHRAGTLSFYSVSDGVTLLHQIQTTFTEPLYPGFSIHTAYHRYSRVGKNCSANQSSPTQNGTVTILDSYH